MDLAKLKEVRDKSNIPINQLYLLYLSVIDYKAFIKEKDYLDKSIIDKYFIYNPIANDITPKLKEIKLLLGDVKVPTKIAKEIKKENNELVDELLKIYPQQSGDRLTSTDSNSILIRVKHLKNMYPNLTDKDIIEATKLYLKITDPKFVKGLGNFIYDTQKKESILASIALNKNKEKIKNNEYNIKWN